MTPFRMGFFVYTWSFSISSLLHLLEKSMFPFLAVLYMMNLLFSLLQLCNKGYPHQALGYFPSHRSFERNNQHKCLDVRGCTMGSFWYSHSPVNVSPSVIYTGGLIRRPIAAMEEESAGIVYDHFPGSTSMKCSRTSPS